MVSRRTLLATAGMSAVLGTATSSLTAAPALAAGTVILVSGGAARCVVVTPDSPDPQVTAGADTIVDYIAKSTGATVSTITASAFTATPGVVAIWVGAMPPTMAATIAARRSEVVADGHLLAITPDAVVIIGANSSDGLWGTRFGCHDFVREFLGVRWLMPTANGESVPATSNVAVPEIVEVRNPAQGSRCLYPVPPTATTPWNSGTPAQVWGGRHRSHWKLQQNHFLGVLLSSDKYGTTHPEFYPIRNGVRYIPPAPVTQPDGSKVYNLTGWQPRFSAPGIVEATANEVIAYFDANPGADHCSLSVNDSGGYSEDERGTTYNSIGSYHMSTLYYGYVTNVISRVISLRPDLAAKTYTALAYRDTYDAPAAAVHPRLTVFICRERTFWIDPAIQARDLAHHSSWAGKADNLALYDYVYGHGYVIPRFSRQVAADTAAAAVSLGAVASFSEWNVTWAEGPKPEILLRQMWDPAADPTTIADDWYTACAGSGAADLKQYFSIWEQLWDGPIAATAWFRASAQLTYGRFDNGGYLEGVTDADVQAATTALAAARAAAAGAKEQWRLDVIQTHHDYIVASVKSYPRRAAPPATATAAINLFDNMTAGVNAAAAAAANRPALTAAIVALGLNELSARAPENLGQAWSGVNYHPIWEVGNYVRLAKPNAATVRAHLDDVKVNGTTSAIRDCATTALLIADGKFFNRGLTPRFTSASTTGWNVRNGAATATTANIGNGLYAVSLSGPQLGAYVSQGQRPVIPGFLRTSTWFHLQPGGSSQGCLQTWWTIYDAAGAVIGRRNGDMRPVSDLQPGWLELTQADHLPPTAAAIDVATVIHELGGGTTVRFAGGEIIQTHPTGTYSLAPDPVL